MKLLKEPEPGEPWGVLLFVKTATYHWSYYNMDGSLDRYEIGPIEVQQVWFDISNTEYHPPETKTAHPEE